MKKIKTTILLVALLMAGACTQKTHFQVDMPKDENAGKYPTPEGLGYLGNDLAWEDIADQKSAITHLKYTVTGANGVKEVKEFNSPQEACEWIIPLPVGEYDVLVAANMDAANGFTLSESGGKAPNLTLPTTLTRLKNPSSNPRQAWNGIAHVKVEANKMTTVHLDLDRLMAMFTLKINNVPNGTTIDVSIRNACEIVTLTELRTEGHYGLPSTTISEDVTLGRLTEQNATTGIKEFKVYPTAKGLDKTILMFHIKTNAGIDLDYVGEAPMMENGKKYVLELDYRKLTPFMYITSTTINDWLETWSYDGEILNPQAN